MSPLSPTSPSIPTAFLLPLATALSCGPSERRAIPADFILIVLHSSSTRLPPSRSFNRECDRPKGCDRDFVNEKLADSPGMVYYPSMVYYNRSLLNDLLRRHEPRARQAELRRVGQHPGSRRGERNPGSIPSGRSRRRGAALSSSLVVRADFILIVTYFIPSLRPLQLYTFARPSFEVRWRNF